MSERLGPGDTQAVRATSWLSAEAKLVWMEDWTLDRGGEGCWLPHADLGKRLGMTDNAVQAHRSALEGLQLYERIKRPGARSPGWRPRLPLQCHLQSQRPSPATVDQARQFLEAHLRQMGLRPPDHSRAVLRTEGLSSETRSAKVSGRASTAFDSQAVKQPSTAYSLKGSRVSSHEPEAEAIEAGLPQSVLPSNPNLSSESEIGLETRPIDQRPSNEVFEEGVAGIRERLRAQARALAAEERAKKAAGA